MSNADLNHLIESDYRALKALPKAEVVSAYPTRLSKAHLNSEPKEVLIAGILEARYGRKAVRAWSVGGEVPRKDQAWECPACRRLYPTYAAAKCCREIPIPR